MSNTAVQVNDKRELQLIGGLSIASIVIFINLYLVQGMLPLIAESFSVSKTHATLLLSVTSFTMAFSLLLFAVLSDRIGRKRPIIISLYLLVIVDIIAIFIGDFSQLVALRMVQGVLLASVPAMAMAYFKDELGGNVLLKAGAIYIAANSVGGITGRLLGGMMSEYLQWHEAMALLAALSLIGTILAATMLPDSQFVKPKLGLGKLAVQSDLKGFYHHLANPKLRLIYLVGGVAFMVMVNQFSYIQLHLMASPFMQGPFEVTLIFLCYSSGTYASYRSAKWISKLGIKRVFSLSVLALMLGTLFTLFDSVITIYIGFLVSSFGFFLIHSSCNAWVAFIAKQHRAKATALYLCSYYLGAAIGGPYLLPFWQHWGWQGVVFGSMICLSVLAVLVNKLISPANAKSPVSFTA
ncbi:MFS transporter [Shewanella sp. Choline-02u-19]|uniref:MFS transporter n=1 Tax=unclassified Shewanella TaxID=196818 RepID=UPI000C328D26|nr:MULTISPECIES: MFS transporter [unclassified Shewanella]PKG56587.1 MFS transporter [Shewanella sp. GutDb-MelDb]PKH60610.1 MFS transporter [Shewanella sp. Bg11-22]PKI26962.1 MFS transporter [Shewanella sp. Choline-02u-19]